ncbi:helix-turn-helix domain-containing protein [Paenibacillus barcinonensis]|uniref:helix-turn-helix domain-containing protein n=1 Tax=Paenibacillus barcinonensis TaxID=198119 RepID=UPI001C116FE1|nr:helix-turn-helix domain-containing protein [Paenibacillus barcinonensis]MBU5355087.1 helix-turn-helix domain-containing protein [Paenibacillus barcinonensis]
MNLLKQARQNDTQAMESIIVKFKPKLQKSLYQTHLQNRNDLQQEIKLKIIEAVYRYNIEEVPSFLEFLGENNKHLSS